MSQPKKPKSKRPKQTAMAHEGFEQRQRRRAEEWMAWMRKKVKPWPENQNRDDYHFSWATTVDLDTLNAGTLYEYARESQKLRGLFALHVRELKNLAQETPTKGHSGAKSFPPVMDFEGLTEEQASNALGVWYSLLLGLAEELVENRSFAWVCMERKGKLERLVCDVRGTIHPLFFKMPGVCLAYPHECAGATCAEKLPTLPPPLEQRRVLENGDELVVIRINWRDFTNGELRDEFREFAKNMRPDTIPEPPPKKSKGKNEGRDFTGPLNGLKAMRLLHRYDYRKAMQVAGYSGKHEGNFYRAAERARCLFKVTFPFGEQAHNHERAPSARINKVY
jgi:hypothetical protein